ncbi:MAG: hypothetical protein WKF66_05600 [Pedobacter sp.]
MGSLKPWHAELLEELDFMVVPFELLPDNCYDLVSLKAGTVVLNLMSFDSTKLPEELIELQETFGRKNSQLIHVWEDVWGSRKEQVLSRIKAIVGFNTRIHARKTAVTILSQLEADAFLNENHLQYTVRLKYRYGLVLDSRLVAVAGFSALRKMHNDMDDYRSAELIRFANLQDTTVVGGFTKILAHFIKVHQPDDVMSYADRDWSLGSSYERSGFKHVETTLPSRIFVDKKTLARTFPHRLTNISSENGYFEVYNTGNLKYILACE